jgi:hypothetical protein
MMTSSISTTPSSCHQCALCLLCFSICDDSSTSIGRGQNGLFCDSKHFLCNDCLPLYVRSFYLEDPVRLQTSRCGSCVRCPVADCVSVPWSCECISQQLLLTHEGREVLIRWLKVMNDTVTINFEEREREREKKTDRKNKNV